MNQVVAQFFQRAAESRLRTKEQELQSRLEQTQARIAQLKGVETTRDSVTGELKVQVNLTARQRAEIEAQRQAMLSIRRQLRD